jgi:hypothetical protein
MAELGFMGMMVDPIRRFWIISYVLQLLKYLKIDVDSSYVVNN